jgi:hypothetical protein
MRLIHFVLLALSTVAGCVGADTQPPWKGVVEVSGSAAVERTETVRSLASLVYTFCVTYHVAVTYEDAPLESSADVVDVTANSASPRHVYIPRGGPLQFVFSVNPQDGKPVDVASAISAAIAAHSASGYPGEYALRSPQACCTSSHSDARQRGPKARDCPADERVVDTAGRPNGHGRIGHTDGAQGSGKVSKSAHRARINASKSILGYNPACRAYANGGARLDQ